ncbi:phage recombination protein Bet [Halanaerobium sp.]|uniref:phage recombination protein Bet n=1 Tax=Halanaerobium sp. TaxID=1895664 RepID=UPI000DE70A56|nr:phage recombination protein Bet [Halanaerobium sp.]PUU88186.1 MAG: phage recombination protein Bet [Halanaerobium sp.]PUU90047.1 MAG: phage recombination protein Bet [Halanaerobium sp.]
MGAQNKVVDIESRNKELISFTKKEVETIKRTVASDANTDELRMFLHIAKTYGLDPFNKEIFFWKIKGKPTIMTSRDGYLKIADRHEEYNGLVSDVVRENDKFRRKAQGIDHEYGTNRGDIIGAYALVYRKDREYPVYVFAPFQEYFAGTRVWSQYPSAMILKVAESMALKRAFTVSGLVTAEEMDVQRLNEKDKENPRRPYSKKKKESQDNENEPIEIEAELSEREKEIKKIVGDNKDLRKDLFTYLKEVKEKEGLDKDKHISIDDLSDGQFKQLKNILNTFKKMA